MTPKEALVVIGSAVDALGLLNEHDYAAHEDYLEFVEAWRLVQRLTLRTDKEAK